MYSAKVAIASAALGFWAFSAGAMTSAKDEMSTLTWSLPASRLLLSES